MNVTLADIFESDIFKQVSLTKAVDETPHVPSFVRDLGIFESNGISTRTAVIERYRDALSLIPIRRTLGESVAASSSKRSAQSFIVPSVGPYVDRITVDDLVGVRQFGGEVSATAEYVLDRKIKKMLRHHDLTEEYMLVGALKGLIVDHEGAVIYDLFSSFGLTRPTDIDFALGSSTTDVTELCSRVIDTIEDALRGDGFTGVIGLAGREIFKKLVKNKSVKETYLNWEASSVFREDQRLSTRAFPFAGINFFQYRGTYRRGSSSASFIADNEILFLPVGVEDMYQINYAPSDKIDDAGLPGKPRYISRAIDSKYGKYIEIETQSHPLPIVTRPNALIRGFSSN